MKLAEKLSRVMSEKGISAPDFSLPSAGLRLSATAYPGMR